MKILIKRRGQLVGAFTEEETIRKFDSGELVDSDLAMVEGATGWHELGSYIVQEPLETATSAATSTSSSSTTALIQRPPALPFSRPVVDAPTPAAALLYDEPPAEPEVAVAPEPEMPEEPAAVHKPARSNAFRIGLGCVLAGAVVMALSAYPWAVYVPLFFAGIVAAVVAVSRGRVLAGAALLVAALVLPAAIWLNWPLVAPIQTPFGTFAKSGKVLTPGETGDSVAFRHSEAPVPQEPAAAAPPADEDAQMAEKPEGPELPTGSDMPPATPGRDVQRVVLQRDSMLLFRNQPFRRAAAGEEFEMLAAHAEAGRIYVKGTDATGKVIALSLPANLVTLANPAAANAAPTLFGAGEQPNNANPAIPLGGKAGLAIDVKPIASGGKVRSKNGAAISESNYSSSEAYWSSRDRESRVGLAIQVHNFSNVPKELRMESYFVGVPVTGERTPFLLSSKIEVQSVEAGKNVSTEAYSEAAQNSTNREFSSRTTVDPYSNVGSQLISSGANTGGTKVSGWIVRMLVGGEVVQVRASSPALEQVAKNATAFDRLINTRAPAQAR